MASDHECHSIYEASDKCRFARHNCSDQQSALIPYITAYFCGFPNLQPLALALLSIWLAFLFLVMTRAATSYLSPNLKSIVKFLGISQTLAGVTIFAVGNGSFDLISTFAAVSSGKTGRALGDLIGAAAFITAVVAGSMAIITPFKVPRATFVRDVTFFLGAELLTLGVAVDRRTSLTRGFLLIAYYCVYVTVVLLWHWKANRTNMKTGQRSDLQDDGTDNDTESNDAGLITSLDGSTGVSETTRLLDSSRALYAPTSHEPTSITTTMTTTTTMQAPLGQTNTNTDQQDIADGTLSYFFAMPSLAEFISKLLPSLKNAHGKGIWAHFKAILLSPSDLGFGITVPRIEVPEESPTDLEPPADLLGDPNVQNSTASDTSVTGTLQPPTWLVVIYAFTCPFFLAFNVAANLNNGLTRAGLIGLTIWSLAVSLIFLFVILYIRTSSWRDSCFQNILLAFVGFFTSIAWISLAANEIVGVMQVLGLVLGIDEDSLWFTTSAVGKPLKYLFANLAVARAGMPVLALSACFGGPMFNTLLGIGAGTVYDILGHGSSGCSTDNSHICEFTVPVIILNVEFMILVVWLGLLGGVALNRWRMDRKIGCTLVVIWMASIVFHLLLISALRNWAGKD